VVGHFRFVESPRGGKREKQALPLRLIREKGREATKKKRKSRRGTRTIPLNLRCSKVTKKEKKDGPRSFLGREREGEERVRRLLPLVVGEEGPFTKRRDRNLVLTNQEIVMFRNTR